LDREFFVKLHKYSGAKNSHLSNKSF
jgi:hypothetical protein